MTARNNLNGLIKTEQPSLVITALMVLAFARMWSKAIVNTPGEKFFKGTI